MKRELDLIAGDYESVYRLAAAARRNINTILKGKLYDFRQNASLLEENIAARIRRMDGEIRGMAGRLNRAEAEMLDSRLRELNLLENTVRNLNPAKLLAGGYARIVRGNRNILGVSELQKNDSVDIYMADGVANATVKTVRSNKP